MDTIEMPTHVCVWYTSPPPGVDTSYWHPSREKQEAVLRTGNRNKCIVLFPKACL